MISVQSHQLQLNGNKSYLRYMIRLMLLLTMVLPILAMAQHEPNKVVMLMPFCSNQLLENPNHPNEQLGVLCREYYQGALLALDSLDQLDIRVKLTVLDTENDSLVLTRQLKLPAVKEAQLILGPVLQGGNKVMSSFLKGKEVVQVSPLMTFSKTKINEPNWVSANPGLATYGSFVAQYVEQHFADSGLLVVVNDQSLMDKTITEAIQKNSSKLVKIKLVDANRPADLLPFLKHKGSVHIVIPTATEKTVNKILQQLSDTSLLHHVSVYGFPQWLDFKNSSYLLWEQCHVHLITGYYIDYTNEAVKAFISAYRERFFTEPTEAAFKGYDQALFFISKLNQYGAKKILPRLESEQIPALHTVFTIRQTDEKGGYQNAYVHLLRLKEFTWEELKK